MSEEKNDYNPDEQEPLPEGEEAPPPLTHTMSILRWVILIGLSIFALFMVLHYFRIIPSLSAETSAITQYHCPMHPTYISNQPGDCPICGMTLVPINDIAKTPAASVNDGGEQNVNIAEQPGSEGKSNEFRTDDPNMPRAVPAVYTCPMDPEVVSEKPGKCPKCNMNLVQVVGKSDTDPSREPSAAKSTDSSRSNDMEGMPGMETMPAATGDNGNQGSAPVPGLVPVTIEPERLQLIGVRTGFVKRGRLDGKINVAGFVTPDETRMKNIHLRISGYALELFVDKTGQFVNAGQPLMSLYSEDLYQAEQDFMIARDAIEKDSSAGGEMLGLRYQLFAAARERLKLLGLADEEIAGIEKSDIPGTQMILRSPFSGYVLDKSVLPGQYLSPDQNLFTIADLSEVWVLGDVYEQDIPYVHAGQNARMRLAAFPGDEFEGKIGFVYPTVSQQTRTLKVRLEFPNPSMMIRPGMYAEVEIDRGGQAALIVPSEAVLDGGINQYAFVVHENTHFEPRLLKIGHSSDDWTEVLSGLSEGEEVVTSANFLIDSESRLKAAVAGMGGMPEMPGMTSDKDQQPAHQH